MTTPLTPPSGLGLQTHTTGIDLTTAQFTDAAAQNLNSSMGTDVQGASALAEAILHPTIAPSSEHGISEFREARISPEPPAQAKTTPKPSYFDRFTNSKPVGCLLAPVKLATAPFRLARTGLNSTQKFFHENKYGKIVARGLPAMAIGTSILRSGLGYMSIELQRNEYLENNKLTDKEISAIVALEHIDSDNPIDPQLLNLLAKYPNNANAAQNIISQIFADLHTIKQRQMAQAALLAIIDNSHEISEELRITHRGHILQAANSPVEQVSVSWSQDLELLETYGHETKLTEELIAKMFANARTPHGSLTLSHVLFETFQMNGNLTVGQRTRYQHLVEEEFKKSQQKFGETIAKRLSDEGLLNIESKEYVALKDPQTGAEVFAPYTISADQKVWIDKMTLGLDIERAALLSLMQTHEAWVVDQLPEDASEETLSTIKSRKNTFLQVYPNGFFEFANQLGDKEHFGARIMQSFQTMATEANDLNKTYTGAFWNDMSVGSFGLVGFAGWMLGNWMVPESGMIFGFYSGFGSASLFTPNHVSESYYYHRDPLIFALPGEGVMYDSPKDQ